MEFTIREVRRGDEAGIDRLLEGLDGRSRYRRWFSAGVDIERAVEWAAYPELVDAVGLLAVVDGDFVGHGVLVVAPDGGGEVAFEVAAPWRRHGVATALLEGLLDLAGSRGLREVHATVLCDNADMLAVMRGRGAHSDSTSGGTVAVTLPVAARPPTALAWPGAPADAGPELPLVAVPHA